MIINVARVGGVLHLLGDFTLIHASFALFLRPASPDLPAVTECRLPPPLYARIGNPYTKTQVHE